MQPGKFRGAALGLLLGLVPGIVAAQEPQRSAPPRARVANINLLTIGAGQAAFNHPNFEAHRYPAFTYARRILRREIRPLPIWVRGAFQYLADKSRCAQCYSLWDVGTYEAIKDAGPERVSDSTTDLALRFETLADVLHSAHSALYGGVGFVLHTLTFTSRGADFGHTGKATLTQTSPSTFVGLRVFSATQTYTGYTEVRFGRVFGETDELPVGQLFVTKESFEFKGTNAAFIEAGLGFHW